MVTCINLIIEMSPRFVLGRENVPCVAEVVNRSLKADCTDFYNSKLFCKLKLLLSQNFVHYFYQILDLWTSDNYLKRDTYKIKSCHFSPRAKNKQSQSQMICTGKKSSCCKIKQSVHT